MPISRPSSHARSRFAKAGHRSIQRFLRPFRSTMTRSHIAADPYSLWLTKTKLRESLAG